MELDTALKSKVHFTGTISNTKVRSLMINYDILILPSRHDGWGAVVNEAIQNGLFVIASDTCGAKDLIHDELRGTIFKRNQTFDLYQSIDKAVRNIEKIRDRKQENGPGSCTRNGHDHSSRHSNQLE